MYPNMYFVHKNKKIMEHAFENQNVQINVRIKNNALIGGKENSRWHDIVIKLELLSYHKGPTILID